MSFPEMLALLMFVPVIASMGGNIGSQSSTIVVRGFATARIDYNNLTKFLTRELAISGLIGICCGVLVGFIAHIWHKTSALGFTVGVSMSLGIIASALMGALIPFFFRLIKVDPAIAAGPLVTTANDILCLAIYYGVALLMLS
jgi:magnesium transporter